MIVSSLDLLKKSIALIKKDYYILLLPIICLFILNLFVSKLSTVSKEELDAFINSSAYISIGLFFELIFSFIIAVIVSMLKNLKEEEEILFGKCMVNSLKKVHVIFICSLILFLPLGAIIGYLPKHSIVQFGVLIIMLIAMVIRLLIAVIAINDNLGIIKTLFKLYIFLRLNSRTFISFSFHFWSIIFSTVLISFVFFLIPHIGPYFLFTVAFGSICVLSVSLTYIYYVEYNERRC